MISVVNINKDRLIILKRRVARKVKSVLDESVWRIKFSKQILHILVFPILVLFLEHNFKSHVSV